MLCLFRQGDRILVNQAHGALKRQDYCRPLGGGLEFGKASAEALVREIREALGAEVVNLRKLGPWRTCSSATASPATHWW